MKYLTLLLLVSCAYQPKTYTVTQRYKVIGVKCAQGYYYSYEYNACVKENYVSAQDNPSGVSIDRTHTYSSPEAPRAPMDAFLPSERAKVRALTKKPLKRQLGCQKLFKQINRCMQ